MHPVLVRLVAVFLLLMQGLNASAPGQVVCIPIQDCGRHDQGESATCGHCDHAGCDDRRIGREGTSHDHGPFNAAIHSDDECGCHVHVPIPGGQQVPRTPASGGPDIKTILVPQVLAIVHGWGCEPPAAVSVRFQPPDFSASDQVRALRTTRLLI